MRGSSGALANAWVRVYTALWLETLGFAAIVALGGGALVDPTRHLLALRLSARTNPAPSLGHVLELSAHNLPVAAWPLLLGAAGARGHRFARRLADTALLACITLNTLPVGAALGAYGTALLPYIPQLPLEWAALAAGAACWLAHRQEPHTAGKGLACLALIALLLVCAAVLETTAVPHR